MSKILRVGNGDYKVLVKEGGSITLDTTDNALNKTGTVVVTGNLEVKGTTTTVDSTIVTIADNIIVLKNGKIVALPRKQNLEELTENLLICPTNEMVDKLSVYAEAGVDEIIISSGFGQNQSEMIESMHRISEEVIPYFKKFNTQVA